MTTINFNEERTYGIEIEFLGDANTRRAVANLIQTKGVNCRTEEYNHGTKNYWKVITDSTCGCELVSPILKGRDGLNQLKIVCDALDELNIKVNRKCGLHVHHDINDFQILQMRNLFASYIKFEELFDKMQPISRRANNNDYCKSMKMGRQINSTLKRLSEAKTVSDMADLFDTRYIKLNIQSYLKYGTVEFRQHGGTTDYEKIYNWVLLTQRLVQTATERNMRYDMTETWKDMGHFASVLSMLKSKGASEEIINVLGFYRKRIKALAA